MATLSRVDGVADFSQSHFVMLPFSEKQQLTAIILQGSVGSAAVSIEWQLPEDTVPFPEDLRSFCSHLICAFPKTVADVESLHSEMVSPSDDSDSENEQSPATSRPKVSPVAPKLLSPVFETRGHHKYAVMNLVDGVINSNFSLCLAFLQPTAVCLHILQPVKMRPVSCLFFTFIRLDGTRCHASHDSRWASCACLV